MMIKMNEQNNENKLIIPSYQRGKQYSKTEKVHLIKNDILKRG